MSETIYHHRNREPVSNKKVRGYGAVSRQKVINGVRKACQGRPVNDDDLAKLAQTVEETIRAQGSAEVGANDVGLAILGPLRELDQVAYLRFASVYQNFDSLDDFAQAVEDLRHSHKDDER